jgi:hypothetical protein
MTEKWILYDNKVENSFIKTENSLVNKIIKRLGKNVLSSFYSDSDPIIKRGKRTSKLFEELTLLGESKKYKVNSHSLSKEFKTKYQQFVNREWLYDLVWYTEGDSYCPKEFRLIVESEWQKRRKEDKNDDKLSGIKYDFQKLLLANTGLKVMIFPTIGSDQELKELSEYFDQAINTYKSRGKGHFLFIAFCNKEKSFYYKYK